MFSSDEFKKRIKAFPQRYWDNFDEVWKWKLKVETEGSAHSLDEDHRKEAYRRLSLILPRWQTYRNGNNSDSLGTLRDAISRIEEEYNQLRGYSLLEFDEVPTEILEKIWHELGRVKEKDGHRNKSGCYSAVAVSKPLLLIWGQTPAFDSFVRKHMAMTYDIPKYACNWNLDAWINALKQLSRTLNDNEETVKLMKDETIKRYGKGTTVPYGRYIDVYYWKGP